MDLRLPLEPDTLKPEHIRNSIGVVSDTELAAALSVSTTTLAIWRSKKIGPPYVKLGKNVFYTYNDLCTWVDTEAKVRRTHSDRREQKTSDDPEVVCRQAS